MAEWIDVVPAYGADYKTQKAVKEAWEAGKDFQVVSYGPMGGKYLNNRDARTYAPGAHIMVRYSNRSKVVEVKNK
jgi:hypothetical protein